MGERILLTGSPTSASNQLCAHLGLVPPSTPTPTLFTPAQFETMRACSDQGELFGMINKQMNKVLEFKTRGAGRNLDGNTRVRHATSGMMVLKK